MWRGGLSRRGSTLLVLFHATSLLVVISTPAAVDAGRRVRRSGTAPEPHPNGASGNGPDHVACRCAADQWEGILRSVEREFYLAGQADFDRPAAADGPHLRAVELESNMAVHYDFRNGLFASHNFDTGLRTVIDYNMGIQYVVDGGKCRIRPAPQVMNQMCLPDGAQLDGKYRLSGGDGEAAVEMWKVVGPHNATLRASVSLQHCLPVAEETFSLADDYAQVTSSSYVNVQVGINDRQVFHVPAQCRTASRPMMPPLARATRVV